MVTRHTADIVRHLEKQHELLVDAYSSKSDELHKLQIEEEMLMRKFFDLMSAQGLMKTIMARMGKSAHRLLSAEMKSYESTDFVQPVTLSQFSTLVTMSSK